MIDGIIRHIILRDTYFFSAIKTFLVEAALKKIYILDVSKNLVDSSNFFTPLGCGFGHLKDTTWSIEIWIGLLVQ